MPTGPPPSSTPARTPASSCRPGAAWASASAAWCPCAREPCATCATATSPSPPLATASASRPACRLLPAPARSTSRKGSPMTSTAERFDLTIDGSGAGTPSAPAPTAPMAPKGLNSRLSIATTERRHVPKRSGKPDPAGHLTPEEIEALGAELDALRQEILASRGARDAAYIHKVLKWQRGLEMSSRAVLLFSLFPPAWLVGTAGLSVAKILENMELGHNIMHGQWDWMRDPNIHSSTWDWDTASTSAGWKHSHNYLHHTYTNVVGLDKDVGYEIMRVDPKQKWEPRFLAQPIINVLLMLFFEWGVAVHDMDIEAIKAGTK